MKKEYLKDIAKQMCQTALEQFDGYSLEECENLSEDDKDYILNHIGKECLIIKNKIRDIEIYGLYSTPLLVDYCNNKEFLWKILVT